MMDNLEQEKKKAVDADQKEIIKFRDLLKGPIMFFQQFTGINAIIYNTVTIFQTAGSTIDSR